MKNTLRKNIKNQKGVALLMALSFMIFMMFIATEVGRDSTIEYVASSNSLKKLRAYYSAKSGLKISLLRIYFYEKNYKRWASTLGSNKHLLNLIWQFPMSWPFLIPDEATEAQKDAVNKSLKDSLFQNSSYSTTIKPETQKIDINLLRHSSENIKNYIKNILMNAFAIESESNSQLAQYTEADFEKVLFNIIDWIDTDNASLNGGSESSYYDIEQFPPNRYLRTLDELQMVADMNPVFFEFLKERITLYGEQGLNINEMPRPQVSALFPDATKETLDDYMERLSGENPQPFSNEKEFYGFVESLGWNTEELKESKVNLFFTNPKSFRIISTGVYNNQSVTIEAVTFNFQDVKDQILKTKKTKSKTTTTSPGRPTSSPPRRPVSQEPSIPTIVQWEEY